METFLNIVFLAVLLFFLVSGFRRGFVRSLADLVGCVASIVLAVKFSSRLAAVARPFLREWVPSWPAGLLLNRVIAAVVLFIVLEFLVQGIAAGLDRLFRLPGLRQINALLGGVFGLLKGGAVLLMLFSVMQVFLPAEKLWKSGAYLEKYNGSTVFRYVYTHNPVSSMLEKDLKNGVGINEKQKQEL